jgi:uncharacterized protein (DUF427 family)
VARVDGGTSSRALLRYITKPASHRQQPTNQQPFFLSSQNKTSIIMVQVIANGQVIADSTNTVEVEGNQYFPPGDVKLDLFSRSGTS